MQNAYGCLILLGLAGLTAPAAPQEAPAPDAPELAESYRMPGVPFDELQRRAHEAREAGQLDEAFRFFRAGVELNPLWHEGWFYVGSIHYARARFAEARDAFGRVTTAVPDWGGAWALAGFTEFRLGEYDRAQVQLTRAASLGIEGSPDIDAGVQHHLALLKIRRGNFEGSVQHLLWLARSQPPAPPLLDACGLMMLRIATLPSDLPDDQRPLVRDMGMATYASLADRQDEARPLFEDLVARYPDTPGVAGAYGLFLSARGLDGALDMLNREVELFPDNVRAHLEIAFQHLEYGNPVDALPSARASVRLSPDVYTSHFALGRALVAGDELEEGIAELERAAELNPELREIQVALARAYALADRPGDVERARQKLLELDARQQPTQPR